MKVLKHFSIYGKANSYIVGPEKGGDAILIDPGVMDIHMLNLIEDNNYYIKSILVTHRHFHHIEALKTILKIYNADIYSYYSQIGEFTSNSLMDGESINLSGITVESIHIPGHSPDSLVYKIGENLFVGDVLSAGLLGKTEGKVEEEMLLDGVESKIMTLEDHIMVFPGHGPPSILETEKKMVNLYDPLK